MIGRRIAPAVVAALAVLALVDCHGTYRPFEVADRCGCGVDRWCRVTGASTECVPFPATCPDPPTCACVGRRNDACREELGRIWVFEPRAVGACDECSREEYCVASGAGRACGLLPPQCEEDATCACFLRMRRAMSCDDGSGRIVASAP